MKAKAIIFAGIFAMLSNTAFAVTVDDANQAMEDCGLHPGTTLRSHGKMIYSLPMPDGTPGMFKCVVQKGYRPIVQEGHPDYYDGYFCGLSFDGVSMVNECNTRG